MTVQNELQIPERAGLDEEAYEVLRVWMRSDGRSHTLVHPSIVEQPEAFGAMLANTVRDCAAAYAAERRADGDEVLKRIFEGMYAKLSGTEPNASGERSN